MGRPLNKRLFGVAGVGPTAAGNEIKVNFHNGSGVKEGYIVKQLGSKKFRCEEIETAGTFDCTLKTGILPAALSAGEMSISFKMDDSSCAKCFRCKNIFFTLFSQKRARKEKNFNF